MGPRVATALTEDSPPPEVDEPDAPDEDAEPLAMTELDPDETAEAEAAETRFPNPQPLREALLAVRANPDDRAVREAAAKMLWERMSQMAPRKLRRDPQRALELANLAASDAIEKVRACTSLDHPDPRIGNAKTWAWALGWLRHRLSKSLKRERTRRLGKKKLKKRLNREAASAEPPLTSEAQSVRHQHLRRQRLCLDDVKVEIHRVMLTGLPRDLRKEATTHRLGATPDVLSRQIKAFELTRGMGMDWQDVAKALGLGVKPASRTLLKVLAHRGCAALRLGTVSLLRLSCTPERRRMLQAIEQHIESVGENA